MMWYKEISIPTNATREQIWKLWTDVDNWNSWDEEIIQSQLQGDFIVGSKGSLAAKGAPKATFKLLAVDQLNSFISRSNLPFTKMDFIHNMEEKNGQLFITHGIKIKGLLTFLFSRVIGKKLIAELPKAMNNLSEIAKNIK